MAIIRWLVGGLIGGETGVGIWLLVRYFVHYEVDWMALGVGFLTGLGATMPPTCTIEEPGFVKGTLACLIAIGTIAAAKYLVFAFLTEGIAHVNPIQSWTLGSSLVRTGDCHRVQGRCRGGMEVTETAARRPRQRPPAPAVERPPAAFHRSPLWQLARGRAA